MKKNKSGYRRAMAVCIAFAVILITSCIVSEYISSAVTKEDDITRYIDTDNTNTDNINAGTDEENTETSKADNREENVSDIPDTTDTQNRGEAESVKDADIKDTDIKDTDDIQLTEEADIIIGRELIPCASTDKEYGNVGVMTEVTGGVYYIIYYPQSDFEALDEAVIKRARELAYAEGDILNEAYPELTDAERTVFVDYETYVQDAFLSVCYKIKGLRNTEEGYEEVNTGYFPSVFNLVQGQYIPAEDMFFPAYYSIIKQRLGEWLSKNVSGTKLKEGFMTTDHYEICDYEFYYFKNGKLIFYFPDGKLAGVNNGSFSYAAEYDEALPFMWYLADGTKYEIPIRELDPTKPMIALSIDDGPYTPVTDRIIELFKKYDARCTFFILGWRLDYKTTWKDTAVKAFEEGFEIGSHGFNHIYMGKSTPSELWTDINKGSLNIAKYLGRAPLILRPPYGNRNEYMQEYLNFPMIVWGVDSSDWAVKKESNAVDQIVKKIKNGAKDGAVVLMHDIYSVTADALEIVVPYLTEQGYQLVTISELYYYKGIDLNNGGIYSSVE